MAKTAITGRYVWAHSVREILKEAGTFDEYKVYVLTYEHWAGGDLLYGVYRMKGHAKAREYAEALQAHGYERQESR